MCKRFNRDDMTLIVGDGEGDLEMNAFGEIKRCGGQPGFLVGHGLKMARLTGLTGT